MPTPDDANTLTALVAGLDATAKAMEAKWGVERLPLLVPAELRAKFEAQRTKCYEALEDAWHSDMLTRDQLERAKRMVVGMERGWAALDAAATQDSQLPIAAVTTVLETAGHHGRVIAVVASNAEASHVMAEGRAVDVYTMEEIANIVAALPEAITAARRVFPGAQVQPPKRDRSWVKDGDPIPFGD